MKSSGQRIVDALEAGRLGEFEFILDDLDLYDTNEFYIQVHAPDGYKVSRPEESRYVMTLIEETGASPFLKVVLGESYSMDISLINLCNPTTSFISFDGISYASSAGVGSIQVEWNPAMLESYNEEYASTCIPDLIRYNVLAAQSPFDFSSYTIRDVSQRADGVSIRHQETDEIHMIVDDLVPGETYSLLVTATAGDIISDHSFQTKIILGAKDDSFLENDEENGRVTGERKRIVRYD